MLQISFRRLVLVPVLVLSAFLSTIALPLLAQPVLESADAYLRAEAETGFSGSVLLVQNGTSVHARGYGLADRDKQIPNRAHTVFPIGSIVKLFTRDAIHVLQEQGKLSFDDTLARFFPSVPADKSGITIEQLIQHRSGLDTYHGPDFEPLTREQAIARIFEQTLLFPPGADGSYSNSGYSVLAAIVELVSGKSFPQFVMDELVRPAGLKQTGFYGYDAWDKANVAIGYEAEQHGSVNSPAYWESPTWGLMGGGGIGSTVGELYSWMQWRKSRFGFSLPPTPPYDFEKGTRTDQAAVFAAGGGNWGYYAVFVEFGDGNAVVVMSNADDDGVEDMILIESLANILYGEPPVVRAAPKLLQADKLSESIVGRRLQAFLAVVNGGDETAKRSFVLSNMDRGFQQNVDRMLSFFDAVRQELGPDAMVSSFLQPDEFVIKAYVQNRMTHQWYEVHLEVDERAPNLISGIRTDESDEPGGRGERDERRSSESGACSDRRLPEDPVGTAAARLLDSVCRDDAAAHRQFVEAMVAPPLIERATKEGLIRMLGQMHEDFGNAAVYSVELASPNEGAFGIEAENGDRFTLQLTVESALPNRITGFGVDVAGPSLQFDSLDDVKKYLDEQSAADAFSGNVLVAKKGKIQFQQAYGFADKAANRKNAPDTRFNLGSINKLFTGVAILKLVEQGKVDLDAPLGTYLTGFRAEISDHVTVRHLLQHRSGLGDYFDTLAFRDRRTSLNTIADYLEFLRDLPLDFEPGTAEQYSNAGYELLGAIIEAVSGTSYYKFVEQYVYKPANMSNAGSRHDAPGLAVGYVQQDVSGYDKTNKDWLTPIGTAAGGGYATAKDLLNFEQSLLADRLLRRSSTNLLLSRFESEGDEAREGGGGYAGGAPGVNTVLEIDFETGYTVIVLSNFDPPTAEQLGPAILRMFLGD